MVSRSWKIVTITPVLESGNCYIDNFVVIDVTGGCGHVDVTKSTSLKRKCRRLEKISMTGCAESC